MAEPFDTMMADLGDLDVSMLPGGMATADSWLSAEASMGDVALSEESATFEYSQSGVEVEMLDDEEAITEYDMADEGEAYDELQDIEFHDASRASSHPPANDVTLDAPVEDGESLQVPFSSGDVYVPPQSLSSHHAATDASAELPAVDESAAHPAAESVDATSEALVADADADAAIAAAPHASLVSSVPEVPQSNRAGSGHAAAFPFEPAAKVDGSSISQLQSAEAVPPSLSEPDVHGTGTSNQADGEPPHDEEADSIGEHASHEVVVGESTTENGDPHEISEGVYIDPPPPVLLSLPPFAQPVECCLFNHPVSSASLSPTGRDGEGSHTSLLTSNAALGYDEDHGDVDHGQGHAEDAAHQAEENDVTTGEHIDVTQVDAYSGPHQEDRGEGHNPRRDDSQDHDRPIELTGQRAESATAEEALSGEQSHDGEEAHQDNAVDEAQTEALVDASSRESTEISDAEGGAEDADEEGTLDADGVHEHGVGGEGGDFVEHDEFPDDEDEFGDDLPEDLGGETPNQGYTHPGAPDGDVEDSTYAEENTFARTGALDAPEDPHGHIASASTVEAAEEGHQQSHHNGLETGAPTDNHEHLHSADDHREDSIDRGHPVGSELSDATVDAVPHVDADEASGNTYAFKEQARDESTTLSSDDEDGLADDWDDDDEPSPEQPVARSEQLSTGSEQVDGLSRKSSTATLASKTSKRAYDEVELDDFDDDPSQIPAAGSPDAKRLRIQ
ncbi:hypothetical protein BN946_scf184798.g53 [Trametes cinnabarina]|uniref:Uncharacterized protein n=1 Tax=Pycnoporus cinnabarinus TaxID=5643 RepID=A0A060SEC4_PYCCI|nr:hypothetical protein BN946_scf184798.g53 [Trametes cinnabarina]